MTLNFTTIVLEKTSFYQHLFDLKNIDDLTVEQFRGMMEKDIVRIIENIKRDIRKNKLNIKRNEDNVTTYAKVVRAEIDKENTYKDEKNTYKDDVELTSFIEAINLAFASNLQIYNNYMENTIRHYIQNAEKFENIQVDNKTIVELYSTVFDWINQQIGEDMLSVIPLHENDSEKIIGFSTSYSEEMVQLLIAQGEFYEPNGDGAVRGCFLDRDIVAQNVLALIADKVEEISVDKAVKKVTLTSFIDVTFVMQDNTIAELTKSMQMLKADSVVSYLSQTLHQLDKVRIALSMGFKFIYEEDATEYSETTAIEEFVLSPLISFISPEDIQEIAEGVESEAEFVEVLLTDVHSQVEFIQEFMKMDFPYILQTMSDEATLIEVVLSKFKHNDTENMRVIYESVAKLTADMIDIVIEKDSQLLYITDESHRVPLPELEHNVGGVIYSDDKGDDIEDETD